MALFPTATTRVACLNFLLSQIFERYRLSNLTAVIISNIFEKLSHFRQYSCKFPFC